MTCPKSRRRFYRLRLRRQAIERRVVIALSPIGFGPRFNMF
jgi:hypothetical protein